MPSKVHIRSCLNDRKLLHLAPVGCRPDALIPKYSKIVDYGASSEDHNFTTTGYAAVGVQNFDKRSGTEVRESYNVGLYDQRSQIFPPDDVAPEFEHILTSFFYSCHNLSLQIIRAIFSAAGFQDEDSFTSVHHLDQNEQCFTNLRLIHYPAFEQNLDESAYRIGAHTDFGTFTLLFQDSVGGLEIVDPTTGSFSPAHPLPGAVLVIAGDMLQIWTNDKIKAVLHRVVSVPDKERRSIAFFVHPHANLTVQPLVSGDEVAHYSPTTHGEHYLKKTVQSFY